MIRVGITGGIGSGKTYVCQRLQQRGIPIYHCDDEAKRLMVQSDTIRKKLSQLIGNDIYINNELNKPRIPLRQRGQCRQSERYCSSSRPTRLSPMDQAATQSYCRPRVCAPLRVRFSRHR